MTDDFGDDIPEETRSERLARIRGIWEEQANKDKLDRVAMNCFLVYDAFGLDKVIEFLIKQKAKDADLDVNAVKALVCNKDSLIPHEEAMYLFLLEI